MKRLTRGASLTKSGTLGLVVMAVLAVALAIIMNIRPETTTVEMAILLIVSPLAFLVGHKDGDMLAHACTVRLSSFFSFVSDVISDFSNAKRTTAAVIEATGRRKKLEESQARYDTIMRESARHIEEPKLRFLVYSYAVDLKWILVIEHCYMRYDAKTKETKVYSDPEWAYVLPAKHLDEYSNHPKRFERILGNSSLVRFLDLPVRMPGERDKMQLHVHIDRRAFEIEARSDGWSKRNLLSRWKFTIGSKETFATKNKRSKSISPAPADVTTATTPSVIPFPTPSPVIASTTTRALGESKKGRKCQTPAGLGFRRRRRMRREFEAWQEHYSFEIVEPYPQISVRANPNLTMSCKHENTSELRLQSAHCCGPSLSSDEVNSGITKNDDRIGWMEASDIKEGKTELKLFTASTPTAAAAVSAHTAMRAHSCDNHEYPQLFLCLKTSFPSRPASTEQCFPFDGHNTSR